MDDMMARIVRRLAARADQTPAAKRAIGRMVNKPQAPKAQMLSQGYIPPTYRAYYERLLRDRPEEAKAFWDKWVVLPRDSRRR